jgi:predicted Zn-ribbon and HTH transcriptional regulator
MVPEMTAPERVWVRTCQECGFLQRAKDPSTYNGDRWKSVKCNLCKSEALDYGHDGFTIINNKIERIKDDSEY